jgi:hypothetical protein
VHRAGRLEVRDVDRDVLGNVGGQRLDVQLARDLLEHAAALHSGRVLGAGELDENGRVHLLAQVHLDQVEVHHVGAHRVQLLVLHHDRDHGVAADLQVDHGRAGVQRLAQRARIDLERLALAAAAAVDDARHEAGPAQAADRTRPLLGALLYGQLGALRGSHDGGAV